MRVKNSVKLIKYKELTNYPSESYMVKLVLDDRSSFIRSPVEKPREAKIFDTQPALELFRDF